MLKLIANGKDNAMIAAELHISPKTVKNHISNILMKLQIENRIQAAVYAVQVRHRLERFCAERREEGAQPRQLTVGVVQPARSARRSPPPPAPPELCPGTEDARSSFSVRSRSPSSASAAA